MRAAEALGPRRASHLVKEAIFERRRFLHGPKDDSIAPPTSILKPSGSAGEEEDVETQERRARAELFRQADVSALKDFFGAAVSAGARVEVPLVIDDDCTVVEDADFAASPLSRYVPAEDSEGAAAAGDTGNSTADAAGGAGEARVAGAGAGAGSDAGGSRDAGGDSGDDDNDGDAEFSRARRGGRRGAARGRKAPAAKRARVGDK